MPHIRHIPLQAAIAFDQFVNTLCGGWADETLSARCWRLQTESTGWRIARKIIDGLFFWQPAHCKQAYYSELWQTHQPPVIRQTQPKEDYGR